MTEVQTDQSKVGGEATKPEINSLNDVWEGDFFQHGLETLDTVEKKPPVQSKDDCPECEKEKAAALAAQKAAKPAEKVDDRKPYKVLKVQGKDVPVYSEEELMALAMKGMDYTVKTQGVAEEKRQVQAEKSEFAKTIDQKFAELMERLNKGAPDAKKEAPKAEIVPEEKSVEEEFGIDPELADPWAMKLAGEVKSMRKNNANLEKTVQFFLLDKIVGTLQESITNATKDFPISDIVDPETGKNLTQAHFVSLLKTKLESPENKNKPLPEIAKEAVKELHMSQKMTSDATTEKVKGDAVSEDMNIEEFKAKYPKLFGKLSDQTVAEYLAAKDKVPPTLKSKGAEIDAKSKPGAVDSDNVGDYIDAAFQDEDILKAFNTR